MDSHWWNEVITIGFAHMLAGKAVSIAQGMAAGMPPSMIVLLTVYVDSMALCILYPILIFAHEHLLDAPLYERHMKRVFDSAQKGVDRVGRFTIVGLFAFVWFPFMMTGVIVGAVLGFLMGLRTWLIMATVILGTTTAVVSWVYAYDRLFSWLTVIDGHTVQGFLLVVIAGVIARRFMRQKRVNALKRPPERLSSP